MMVFWSNAGFSQAEPAFTTDGSKIIDADGNEVELKVSTGLALTMDKRCLTAFGEDPIWQLTLPQ